MDHPWLRHYPQRAPHEIEVGYGNLAELLIATAARHPEYVATTLNDVDITYGDLNRKANGFARACQDLGIGKGDKVALLLPNTPTYVIAFFGLMKIGAVVANVNVSASGAELTRFLAISQATAIVSLDIFIQNFYKVWKETKIRTVLIHSVIGLEKKLALEEEAPRPLIFNEQVEAHSTDEPPLAAGGSDLAVLQFTSGSTGAPKAAMLTHRSIIASVLQLDLWVDVEARDNAAVICIIPFFHVFGLSACMVLSVLKGYRMILMARFDWFDLLPMISVVEKYKPLSFPAVPSLWAALLSSPKVTRDLLAPIKVPTSGGAPLPSWVRKKYRELTGGPIYVAYGLSEASSATHFAPFPQGAPEGSIGVPLPGTDVRIVDIETGNIDLAAGEVGELMVKGPQIMAGYYNAPELNAMALREGWFHTGDLARSDEEGFFYLVDRKDDLIIVGGFNVYPSEVEEVLRKHPAVKDVAVIGTADRLRGQTVTAYVVPQENTSPSKEDLLALCRASLLDYKVPKVIHFREAIPRDPVGKPLHRMLRLEK